jgi:outer membrane receptor protein involved in Fe transport
MQRLCAASAAALLLGAAGAARAEQGVSLEEVVVTAQKRPERALEAPIALSVFSDSRIQELGIHNLTDVGLYTPGLRVQEQSVNNPGYQVRGITSDNANVFEEPRVSLFQDGVSISKLQGSSLEVFDMERVEVAKGPQSTLYGRSALIGAINLVQKKASLTGLEGYLHAEAGELNYRMGEGAVNLPLSDVLAVRVSGRVRVRDGYIDNLLGGDAFQSQDSWAFRTAVKYAPTDKLNVDLIVNYEENHPTGTAFKSHNVLPANPLTGQVLGDLQPWTGATTSAPSNFEGGHGLDEDRRVGGATALIDYKLTPALTLHSITAWRGYKSTDPFDADGTALPILNGIVYSRGDQWSQEFRVNYDDGGRIRGFVGGSFFRNSDKERVPLQFDERMALAQLTGALYGPAVGLPAGVALPAPAFSNTAFTGALMRGLVAAQSAGKIILSPAQASAIAANLLPNHREQNQLSSQVTAADLFGDVTFKVTEKFEITGGLRYSHSRQTTGFGGSVTERSILGSAIAAAQIASVGTPGAIALGNAILAALASPQVQLIPAASLPLFGLTDQATANNGSLSYGRDKDDGLTWRVLGRYAVAPDASLYASYARGRRPPVQSAGPPSTPGGVPSLGVVAAEQVDSYEVGGKGVFLDRRLSADVALYTYRYRHFQSTEQVGTRFFATDAGRATAYGAELQVDWTPVDNLQLYGTYAYNHARLKSGVLAGNHFRLSPDNMASFAATWTIPAMGGEVRVMPSYSWQSKMFFNDNDDRPDLQQPPNALVADNVQDELQKSFGIANLRVSWTPTSGGPTVEVFATNLFDKKYIIDAGNTGDAFGLPTFIAGPPRVAGAGVYWKFK